MRNRIKYSKALLAGLFVCMIQPAHAADKSSSIFDSALTITLMLLMVVLLLVIGLLAYILLGAADIKRKRNEKKANVSTVTGILMLPLLLLGGAGHAQEKADAVVTTTINMIGDMPASTFYLMISVIFLELVIILALLINIRFLLKSDKKKLVTEGLPAEKLEEIRKNKLSWWDRFNKLRPVSQEAELDLGHEYDGIRELNNRLPPWWLYGFYVTIVFAFIYIWRFHVSHDGPSSQEEYEQSVVKAERDIKNYLKAKGEAVDENTVTLLTSAEDISEGKKIFINSCAACHKPTGGGDVGPNLTDNYWMNGNDIGSVFKVIRYGINAMPQWQNTYSNKQIAQVASYVKSLQGTNPPDAKGPQGVEIKEEKAPAKNAADSATVIAENKP